MRPGGCQERRRTGSSRPSPMTLRPAALHRPLSRSLVKQHAGGHGRVEAFDGPGQGIVMAPSACSIKACRHAISLIADEQRHRLSKI